MKIRIREVHFNSQIYMHSAYSNSLIIIFIILMSSGAFLRFIAYATTPEVPDDKGVISVQL